MAGPAGTLGVPAPPAQASAARLRVPLTGPPLPHHRRPQDWLPTADRRYGGGASLKPDGFVTKLFFLGNWSEGVAGLQDSGLLDPDVLTTSPLPGPPSADGSGRVLPPGSVPAGAAVLEFNSYAHAMAYVRCEGSGPRRRPCRATHVQHSAGVGTARRLDHVTRVATPPPPPPAQGICGDYLTVFGGKTCPFLPGVPCTSSGVNCTDPAALDALVRAGPRLAPLLLALSPCLLRRGWCTAAQRLCS